MRGRVRQLRRAGRCHSATRQGCGRVLRLHVRRVDCGGSVVRVSVAVAICASTSVTRMCSSAASSAGTWLRPPMCRSSIPQFKGALPCA